MTLIAKFDCQDGIVVLADSQETAGDYRVEVNKNKPIQAGNYELLVGGSGHIGELIDGMNEVLTDALSSVPSGHTEGQLGKILKDAIVLYHRHEVQEHPAPKNKKRMEFIVCVRDVAAQRAFSWRIAGNIIRLAGPCELVGWETALYHGLVAPYFQQGGPPLPIQQGIILGLRLFMLAENTIYIDEPTNLMIVTPSQMHVEDQKEVDAMRTVVARYDELLRDLLMSCPDTSIPEDELRKKISDFGDAAVKLHNAYVAAAGTRAFLAGKFFVNDQPFPRWPLGTEFTMYGNGMFTAKQLSEEQRKAIRQIVKVGSGMPGDNRPEPDK